MSCQMTLVCQHPPCSIPPSSIWSVADHDPWPPCGVGEEREDNIPPQKSMYINDAARRLFSYLHPGADELLCGLLFWEQQHTWLTHTVTQIDAETWLLCSDPEHPWRRPSSDSWVILHLLLEIMTHASLQYLQYLGSCNQIETTNLTETCVWSVSVMKAYLFAERLMSFTLEADWKWHLAAAYESQVSWSQWDHVASSSEVPPSPIHVCSGGMSLSPVPKWTREYYLMYLIERFKMQRILNMSIFTLWSWFFNSSEGTSFFTACIIVILVAHLWTCWHS